MRTRIAGLAIAGLLAVLVVVSVGTAGAAGKPTKAACNLKVGVTLSPGISLKPTTGTFSGSGGTINCTGTLFGRNVVNQKGSLSLSGSYGPDTCASGQGRGTFSATIGTQKASGSFTYKRVGSEGTFSGSATNGLGSTATVKGGFNFQPATGQDCARVKVTKATVTGAATLTG